MFEIIYTDELDIHNFEFPTFLELILFSCSNVDSLA